MIRPATIFFVLLSLCLATPAHDAKGPQRKLQISEFGKTKDGATVYRYVLTNNKNLEAVVISYGARLVSVKTPDRNGKIADVVFGYDDLIGYDLDKAYIVATVVLFSNRLAGDEFVLDGATFH